MTMMTPDRATRDVAINGIAARQQGVITREQLRGFGLSDRAIDELIRRGWLCVLHRGVYRLGPVSAPCMREMAASLACGTQACTAARSAAAMWEALPPWPGDVDVLVTGACRSHSGIRVIRTRTLRPSEVTRLDGVPVTRPVRTLLDLAMVASPREVERAWAQAFAKRLVTLPEMKQALADAGPRRGVRTLRALLTSRPQLTRSEAEERFLAAVRLARLPRPETNVHVAGCEVDFLWRDARLVVEIDGFEFHASPDAFQRDRARDLMLTSRGMRIVRITWQQLTGDSAAVLTRVAEALAWGRRDGWPSHGARERGQ